MSSKIEIINLGLILAHQPTIFTIDEDNKRARTAKAVYPIALSEVLSDRNWGFAVKRENLSLDAATPEFDWSYGFTKPNDYLKMIQTENDEDYTEEGGLILSNNNVLRIKYLFLQENSNVYTPGFVSTLSARLASIFAISLAQDFALSAQLDVIYTKRLALAGSIAAQSGGAKDFIIDDWTDSRFGYPSANRSGR